MNDPSLQHTARAKRSQRWIFTTLVGLLTLIAAGCTAFGDPPHSEDASAADTLTTSDSSDVTTEDTRVCLEGDECPTEISLEVIGASFVPSGVKVLALTGDGGHLYAATEEPSATFVKLVSINVDASPAIASQSFGTILPLRSDGPIALTVSKNLLVVHNGNLLLTYPVSNDGTVGVEPLLSLVGTSLMDPASFAAIAPIPPAALGSSLGEAVVIECNNAVGDSCDAPQLKWLRLKQTDTPTTDCPLTNRECECGTFEGNDVCVEVAASLDLRSNQGQINARSLLSLSFGGSIGLGGVITGNPTFHFRLEAGDNPQLSTRNGAGDTQNTSSSIQIKLLKDGVFPVLSNERLLINEYTQDENLVIDGVELLQQFNFTTENVRAFGVLDGAIIPLAGQSNFYAVRADGVEEDIAPLSNWGGFQAATQLLGAFYVIADNNLYKIEPADTP